MLNMFTGMPMRVEKRDLESIELQEISLVDKAANKCKFLFFKNEAGGDELDMLLSVLEQGQFDDESDAQICKAVDALTGLETDKRTAIAKTIMAIVKLAGVDIDDETQVRKIDYDSLRWPSFQQQRRVEKTEVDEEALWPSLC